MFKNILNRRPLSLFLTSTCGLFNPENTEEERQTKTACAGGVNCDEEAKPVNFMEKKKFSILTVKPFPSGALTRVWRLRAGPIKQGHFTRQTRRRRHYQWMVQVDHRICRAIFSLSPLSGSSPREGERPCSPLRGCRRVTRRGFGTVRERGDGHYQSIFTSPLRPEQIARPRRDGDGKFRSLEIASWRQVGTGVTTGSSSVRQSFTRGRERAMGGEGEGRRRGPFLDGCRQVFLPSDDASSAASRGTRAAGEGFFSTYLLLSKLSLSVASWLPNCPGQGPSERSLNTQLARRRAAGQIEPSFLDGSSLKSAQIRPWHLRAAPFLDGSPPSIACTKRRPVISREDIEIDTNTSEREGDRDAHYRERERDAILIIRRDRERYASVRTIHADVNGRWVEREKVGVEGPSSTAAGRSSFPATMQVFCWLAV